MWKQIQISAGLLSKGDKLIIYSQHHVTCFPGYRWHLCYTTPAFERTIPKVSLTEHISCPTSHQLHQDCLKETMTAVPILIRWLKSHKRMKLDQLLSLWHVIWITQNTSHMLLPGLLEGQGEKLDQGLCEIQGLAVKEEGFRGEKGYLSPCFPSGLESETPKLVSFIYWEVATMK